MKLVRIVLGLKASWTCPRPRRRIYWLVDKAWAPMPSLPASTAIAGLTLSLDLAMFGARLMGIKSAASSSSAGPSTSWSSCGDDRHWRDPTRADGTFTRVHIVNNWALWWGIVIMVVASIVGLFAKPEVFVEAFKGLRKKKTAENKDILGHIELPVRLSYIGVPVIGLLGAWMANAWFDVSWAFGISAIPLIIVLTLIAASSTAMTGITPTGSLSKIPQFLFGALDPNTADEPDDRRDVRRGRQQREQPADGPQAGQCSGKPRHQASALIASGRRHRSTRSSTVFLSDYQRAERAGGDARRVAVRLPSALQ